MAGTDTTPTEKATAGWYLVRYGDGDSLVIHSTKDERICFMATPGASPGAMEKIEADAALILAAANACRALSPSDPLQAAEAIPELIKLAEAARDMCAADPLIRTDPNFVSGNAARLLSRLQGGTGE